jgi:3-hydroxybutyrate dehydrogenase
MRERFLEGRTALVTGSVQGIGLAIGKALASAGARLAVHGIATRELAQTAVQMMRDTGAPDARFFDADMREPSAIIAMMDEIKAWGGPDILSSTMRVSKRPPVSPKSRNRLGTIF